MSSAAVDFGPDTMGTPGFFTSAMGGAEDQTDYFDDAYREARPADMAARAPNDAVDPSLLNANYAVRPDQSFAQSMDDPTFAPFFGFSPRSSAEPTAPSDGPNRGVNMAAQHKPGLAAQSDWSAMVPSETAATTALPTQQLSPPTSSDASPVNWADKQFERGLGKPHVRTRYGQITPPNDHSPTSPVMNDAPYAVKSSQFQPTNQTAAAAVAQDASASALAPAPATRKRGRKTNDAGAPEAGPAKRTRKSAGRAKAGDKADGPKSVENDKRQRFLERNRVAASKCRMKKKEWTGNLEGRARELQAERRQLSMMVGSLRDEVLWLKGELLKHTSCDCDRIRQYLDQEVTNLAGGSSGSLGQVLGQGSPLLTSRPASLRSSIDVDAMDGDRSIDSHRGSTYMNSLAESPDPAIKVEDDHKPA